MKNLLILLISLSCSALAQPWMQKLSPEERDNFYAIQNSFYEYIKDKDITDEESGTGYKQFKRWEWFWQSRILEDGRFPNFKNYNEALEKSEKSDKVNKLKSGNEWKTIGPDDSPGGYQGLGRINVVRADPNNNDILWAGAASGGLWYSTDAGQTWECKTDDEPVFEVLGISDIAINPNDTDIMYIASGDKNAFNTYSNGIIKTTDGGETWQTTDMSYTVESTRVVASRVLINPNNTDSVYASGSHGIWLSTNAGDDWTRIRSGWHVNDLEMKPNDPSTLYATQRYSSNIHKSTDGGETWTQINHNVLPDGGVTRSEIAVTADDPNYLVALMAANHNGLEGVFRSNDGGDSWIQLADTIPNMLHWSQNTDDEGGQGWYDLCIAIDPTDKNIIHIGGINVWTTTNGGTDWEISTMWYGGTGNPTIHADQHDLWYTNDGSRLLVGNDGGVYKSDDNGDNFDWIGRGKNTTQFYRIAVSQQTKDLIIGGSQDNGTKLRVDEWDHVLGGDGMECIIYPDDENLIMGSSQRGNISKSTNKGENFSKINSTNGNDYDDIDEEGAWITPFAISPSDTSNMLVGMDDMWRSVNGGTDFDEIQTNQNGKWQFIHYSPSNQNIVYAATNSEFWHSTNSGLSWTKRSRPGNQTITSIEVHPDNSDLVYATNGNWNSDNKVFRSTDGGQNWTNLSSGLPNLPANCVFYQEDSDNRIYVGTDIGIYYRDDNSNGWQELNNGLPNVIVNDIEMHYDSERLYAGTYGRGVYYFDMNPTLDFPNLLGIANNEVAQPIENIILEWSEVPDATNYSLQVSTESNFSDLVVNETNLTETNYQLPLLDNFTEYFWRVKARNSFAESVWSTVWKFRTEMNVAALSSPSDNALGQSLTFTLDWNDVNGAENYDLEVATDIAFSNNLISEETVNSEYGILSTDGLTHFKDYFWRVKAKRSDEEAAWSETYEFQTIIGKVSLSSPTPGLLDQPMSGTLEWESLNGADDYDLQIATNSDFSNIVTSRTGITELSSDYSGFDFETQYFWRVRGSYSAGKGEWSEVNNFTTILQPLELDDNIDKSFSNNTKIDLNWLSVGSQDNYEIQIAEDNSFQNIILNLDNVDGTLQTTEISNLENNKTYFARIRRAKGSSVSAWSDFIEFTTKPETPILVLPEDNQIDFSNTDIFSWTAVDGAEAYKLQVSENEDFSANLVYDNNVTNNEFSPSGLNAGTEYFWRVQAISFSGQNLGDWSSVRSFVTVIGLPNLVQPQNNFETEETSLTLVWEEYENATNYTLQVAEDIEFNDVLQNSENLTNTSLEISSLTPGDYFWRIKAVTNKTESDWSAVWKFTILEVLPIPTKPVLISPVNNSTEQEFSSIQFDWEIVDAAETYFLEIYDDESFTESFYSEEAIETSEKIVNDFKPEKDYWWRVTARNEKGDSENSDVWKFTTKADINPGEFTLISPPNNSKGIEFAEVELVWSSLTENATYNMDFSEFESGDIVETVMATKDTTHVLENLQPNKKYCWEVEASDTQAQNYVTSETWCFTTKQASSVLGTRNGEVFKLYPNPARNEIILSSEDGEMINSIEIFDQNANSIISQNNLNKSEIKIDLKNLSSGKYFISFESENRVYKMNFNISK